MRPIFKWLITLILGTLIFYLTGMTELNFVHLYRWEIIVTVVLCIAIWLIFQWRRTMRLEETNVHIQLLDD